MQQGLKGSIAGVVAAATLLAGGILTVPHAMALEADGQYYSSKQPYVAPSEATTASYSQAPEGYETVYTESMARHGSRGLSSYKYDALDVYKRQRMDCPTRRIRRVAMRRQSCRMDRRSHRHQKSGYQIMTRVPALLKWSQRVGKCGFPTTACHIRLI